jgi:hypothetical protein
MLGLGVALADFCRIISARTRPAFAKHISDGIRLALAE